MRFDPLNPTPDFNGDNRADIYWRNDAANLNAIWMMNGTQVASSSFLPEVAEEAGWKSSFADFNGDRKTDFFWRNTTTGENAIWLMDGGNIQAAYATIAATPDWEYKIADFNADGTSDIFWHNQTTGLVVNWTFQNGALQDWTVMGTVAPEWDAYIADFNGDQKTDLLWRNSRTGDNGVWIFDGANFAQQFMIKSETLGWSPKIADLDGNGRTDIFWHNVLGKNKATLWSNSSIFTQSELDLPTTAIDIGIPSADVQFEIIDLGNQNGILAYDPIENKISVWSISNQSLLSSQITLNTSLYGVNLKLADFDGDGSSDIFGYSRISGEIAINTSRNNYQDTTTRTLDPSLGWRPVLSA
jgi:hypothetical protein